MLRESRYQVKLEADRSIRLPEFAVVPDGPIEIAISPSSPDPVPVQTPGAQRRIIVREEGSTWSVVDCGSYHGFAPSSRERKPLYLSRAYDAEGNLLRVTPLGDGQVERLEAWNKSGGLIYGINVAKKGDRSWRLTIPETAREIEFVTVDGQVVSRVNVEASASETDGGGDAMPFPRTVIHGPEDESIRRFEIVFVSERFSSEQLPLFKSYCEDFVAILRRQPWWNVQLDAIRVSRIDVPSSEHSFNATIPDESRQLNFNADLLFKFVNDRMRTWHVAALLVNDQHPAATAYPEFHCAGATLPPNQAASPAFNPDWFEYLLHEVGHAAFNLADEYDYYDGPGASTDTQFYASESSNIASPNVTDNPKPEELKWRALARLSSNSFLGSKNLECAQCGRQWREPSPLGMFEGGFYHRSGVFRPAHTCRMRELHQPFCRVCVQSMHDALRRFHTTPRLASETAEISFGRLLKSHPWTLAFGISNVGTVDIRNVRCRVETNMPDTGVRVFCAEIEGDASLIARGDWRLVHVTAGPVEELGHYEGRIIIESDDAAPIEVATCVCVLDYSIP